MTPTRTLSWCTRCTRRPTTRAARSCRASSSSASAAGVEPAAVDGVLHGTTVATNAVLQHRGARTGMVTNEGMRDIVHIGRHQRPQPYSVMADMPWQTRPFVQRADRLPVAGRIVPPRGEAIVELDEDAVREAGRHAARKRRRGDRRLLPVLLSRPRARGARRGDPARGGAGLLRDHERRHLAPVPRVRALHDGVHERVRRAGDGPLSGAADRRPGRPRRRAPTCS